MECGRSTIVNKHRAESRIMTVGMYDKGRCARLEDAADQRGFTRTLAQFERSEMSAKALPPMSSERYLRGAGDPQSVMSQGVDPHEDATVG